MVKIRFVCTVDDCVAGTMALLDRVPSIAAGMKRARRRALFIGLLIDLAIVVPIAAVVGIGPAIPAMVAGLIVTCFTYVRFPRTYRRIIARGQRKMLDQGGKGRVGEHTLECTAEGLVEQTQYNRQQHNWAAVQDIFDDGELVVVFMNSAEGHIIPRARILEGDLDTFLAELATRIPVRKADHQVPGPKAPSRDGQLWHRYGWPISRGMIWVCVLSVFLWRIVAWVLPASTPFLVHELVYAILLCALPLVLAVGAAQPEQPVDGECRCRRCGHLLRGLREPRCPECGEPI